MTLGRAVIAACALVGLFLAPAASAEVRITGTNVSAATLGAGDRSVIYYLDLRNDGNGEAAFSVRMTPPAFATRGGRDEGESIDGPRQLALQGAGRLGQLVQDPKFAQPCSDRDSAFHGYSTGPASVDMLLPAGSATTLAVRYATGRRAPWADTDFRLRFTVQPRLVGTYELGQPFFGLAATVTTPSQITTTGPRPGGKLAAHLLLATSPQGTWGEARAPRRVRRGQRVAISGRVLPAVARKRVVLQARRPGGALRTLATVRTDTRGRFRGSWTAAGSGTVELWARYPTQSGDLRADGTSCPLRLRVQ